MLAAAAAVCIVLAAAGYWFGGGGPSPGDPIRSIAVRSQSVISSSKASSLRTHLCSGVMHPREGRREQSWETLDALG